MSDLKKLLNPDDVSIIDATGATNWVPKEPADVILPYLDKRQEESKEEEDASKRLKKAQEVIDGYSKIISECRLLEAQIEEKCNGVKVPISRQNHLRVIEAMGRVFGIETEEITFEQYKRCIEELAKLNDQATPTLEGL